MRQKYVISRDDVKNKLNINEYAVIDNDPKKMAPSMMQMDSFALLGEETYESEKVVKAIAKGMSAVVTILRTHNIFPIEPYATKIAESVVALYHSAEDGSVELFFNDLDLVSV